MKSVLPRSILAIVVCAILSAACPMPVWAQAKPRIEISFTSAAHANPITGRVHVIMIDRGGSS